MPKFSNAGKAIIAQLHPDLQLILNTVIIYYDITMLPSTIRTIYEQKQFFDSGASKTMDSMHLPRPFPEYGGQNYVCAFDCTPWVGKIDFDSEKGKREHYYMAGVIMTIADRLFIDGKIKHKLRWGGRFNIGEGDLVHFELILG